MKIILQTVAAHSRPLPAISHDLILGPRADVEAPSRRHPADVPRVLLRSEASRHQPRHRPDLFDPPGSRPSRLLARQLDGVPYTVSTTRRPAGARTPATASVAFLAQQFAQAGKADDGDEAGPSAEAAAAYRATAERGATLLGPELRVSYHL